MDFCLSEASLIAFRVPRRSPDYATIAWKHRNQGYIEVAKGFDRLDCPALGLLFKRGPPDGCVLRAHWELAPGFLQRHTTI